MPIYEYLCLKCKRPFSFLAGVVADSGEPVCPRCGGKNLSKLISRVARIKSKDRVLEDLSDPSQIGNLEDPKAMAQWAKKMGRALGEETGEDFDEELDEMLDKPAGEKEDMDEE